MDASLADVYTQHYQAGWKAMKSVTLHGGVAYRFPNPWRWWNARRAIKHFRQCVAVKPDSWPSMWALGKAHQALGRDEAALVWFERAAEIETSNADVFREASLQAGFIGQAAKAELYAMRALELRPGDNTLRANYAMALLLAGNVEQALVEVQQAAAENPSDAVNARILTFVKQVASGKRPRPTHLPK
jgi:tetratricopeptide (TPR) repeat protein